MNALDLAMSFVEDVRKQRSIPAVLDRFSATIDAFGFDSYLIAGIPRPGEKLDNYQMASGMPEAWFQRYLDKNYVSRDPVVRRMRSSSMPFTWGETLNDRTTDALGRRIMAEAEEFKMHDGLAVPIFGIDAFQAGVTMGGPVADLSLRDKGALQLASIYVHNQIRELLSEETVESPATRLTPRELECLKWTSSGKTSWEISKILSISQHTVDWYLTSMIRKLGAANRPHAVAEAFRRGILH